MLRLNSHKFRTSILARYVVHVLKAVAILTCEYWNLSTLLVVVCYFLSARVSPERRLQLGFLTQKKCSFPLNRDVPLAGETNAKSTWSFSSRGTLNRGVPLSQRKSSTLYLALLHLFLTTSTQKCMEKIGYKYNTTTNKNIQSFISKYEIRIDGLDQNSVFC